jgi:NAD(P)-dependent dehydrogenase (short-subunit alcohol dehydrogenase family)
VTIVGRRQPDASLEKAIFLQKDLSTMHSAEALANEVSQQWTQGDILVFTNGIFSTAERKVTEEGLELDLAVSYLSRMAFLNKLKTPFQRIFIMGYPGKSIQVPLEDFNSDQSYSAMTAHMRTVVGNEALVTYVADKSPKANVFGLNPGLIRTEIRDNFLGKGTWASWAVEGVVGLLYPSAEAYAEQVLVQLMAAPELGEKSKVLFAADGTVLPPNPFLAEGDHQARVIKESEALLEKALKVKPAKK